MPINYTIISVRPTKLPESEQVRLSEWFATLSPEAQANVLLVREQGYTDGYGDGQWFEAY